VNYPTLLILLRPGESQRDIGDIKGEGLIARWIQKKIQRKIYNVPDYNLELTRRGIGQSKRAGMALKGIAGIPELIYHSGFKHAEQTAFELLKAHNQDDRSDIWVRQCPLLRGQDAGYMFNMSIVEGISRFPWLRGYYKRLGNFIARPPGGESLLDITTRAYLFLELLCREANGKRVIAVSHQGFISAMRFVLERWSYEEASNETHKGLENCGHVVYIYDPTKDRLVQRMFNRKVI
jgi:broad specificity phosphatase PhoE